MADLNKRITVALASLRAAGPNDLRQFFSTHPGLPSASKVEVETMLDMVFGDANDPLVQSFENLIRDWDNASEKDSWVDGTTRNTPDRRALIHKKLASGADLAKRIDTQIPFYFLTPQLVIAKEPKNWYLPPTDGRDYYWNKYLEYLRDRKKWEKRSVLSLSNSTQAIMENLTKPEQTEAYSSRGLVMGFVQSGKTANFMGLIARAADAGYRYIIVLAGTWNILRTQTQRRLDKELLGKELLRDDDTYMVIKPEDWAEFLEHGFDPEDRNHYGWSRITRLDNDYHRLRTSLEPLEFERLDKSKPIYDPANLHKSKARLIVIKKNKIIIEKLCADLKRLKSNLSDIPALIIDDESDQAGLNTIAPPRPGSKEEIERTKTNNAIVELLRLLPRAQLVGYTATPYANAFINLDDPEDLFPRDFIIPLERPDGYMGISDFFDAERDFEELVKTDCKEKEIAFIRRIDHIKGNDDEDLKTAIRSYVLAGAAKLFRQAKDPKRNYRHHTMLIHTSTSKSQHHLTAKKVKKLWDACAFITPNGRDDLKKLWEKDFVPVSAAQGPGEPMPATFAELVPFIDETIRRISGSKNFILVLNSDTKDSPDFTSKPVWKIIVGGNKLSRGYTLEDLTVSYYRRVTIAADSLMQMGRWFGFRKGYKDLVRVFLGVSEGKKSIDLVVRFKEACLMEERFRDELKRYDKPAPGQQRIRPQDIPPLVSMIGQLPPTSRNKMFNAYIENRNFGGQWSTPTLVAADKEGTQLNEKLFSDLLKKGKGLKLHTNLGGKTNDKRDVSVNAWGFEVQMPEMIKFLEGFHWLKSDYKFPDKPSEVKLQLDFLKRKDHSIRSWLVLLPQRKDSFGESFCPLKGHKFTVKERHRIDNRGFQVFGESNHRHVAKWLCAQVNPDKEHIVKPSGKIMESLKDSKRGVMLVYPVREKSKEKTVYIGYELLFPNNTLGYQTTFSVQRKDAKDKVVVTKKYSREHGIWSIQQQSPGS